MRIRLIVLAPVLAFLALAGWAMASPVGAAPDDDFHLISTWCSTGDPSHCAPTSDATKYEVPAALTDIACYAFDPDKSAKCQDRYDLHSAVADTPTSRGNFSHAYPPLFYSVQSWFVSDNIEASALAMRLFNAALFVILSTVVFALLPIRRRPTLLWTWLLTTVPLGLFLVASNNPSGWAAVGVGTAWIALLGYYESEGRRRWGLAACVVASVLMAAGSRGDSAFYVVVAMAVVVFLKFARSRAFLLASILPAALALVALVFFLAAGQSGASVGGFQGGDTTSAAGQLGGMAQVFYNLLSLPFLWVGVFGAWNLGWLDTGLPDIVLWSGAASFIGAGFVGLASVNRRKAVAVAAVAGLLVAVPTFILAASHASLGQGLQPRYILPLIILFAGVLMLEPLGKRIRLTRLQLIAIALALSVGNMVALETNIRRYVTGIDEQGLNLDAGREWWWPGPIGANAVWLLGSLAFAGAVAILIREIHRMGAAAAEPAPVSSTSAVSQPIRGGGQASTS